MGIKSRVILISLGSLLFVSCGGGGGGSSSSNTPTPINPGSNVSPSPINSGGNVSSSSINPGKNIGSTNTNRIENVPSDTRELSGKNIQVALIDSDFVSNKDAFKKAFEKEMEEDNVDYSKYNMDFLNFTNAQNLKELIEKKYPEVTVLDREDGKTDVASTHGLYVLEALKSVNNNKINVIASSIGEFHDGKVFPNEKVGEYRNLLKKFRNSNGVKIFSQSWGDETDIDKLEFNHDKDIKSKDETDSHVVIATKDMVDFYKEHKDDSLFVWANGNEKVNNAQGQAGFPYLVNELEKSWITVVGIESQKIVKTTGDSNFKNEKGEKINLILNSHDEDHLAFPGDKAKWWSISMEHKITIGKTNDGVSLVGSGSSFAAPRVSAAAALVAEKFDWMTNNQIRQTLFTTTDKTELDATDKVVAFDNDGKAIFHKNTDYEKFIRRTELEPDNKYGWGMLNVDRALKGPGAFIDIYSENNSSNNSAEFDANIPRNKVSYFENNIIGDGELHKKGEGTLHLTGNNTYKPSKEFATYVENGDLKVHKVHAGRINIEPNGTLTLGKNAIIGYDIDNKTVLYDEDINPDKITSNVERQVVNNGKLKFEGDTAIIGGNYVAEAGSSTQADFKTKVKVKGNIEFKENANLSIRTTQYVPNGHVIAPLEADSVEGVVPKAEINGMRNSNVLLSDGKVEVEVNRIKAVDYLKDSSESSKNVAENIDKVFDDLDNKVKTKTATAKELAMAATLQSLPVPVVRANTELMSGEIYASAQALTFSQSQNLNKDLSNRLFHLDNLKNSNEANEAWISAIGSDGKLRRDGYASAKTRVYGGQVGVDRRIGNSTVGMAFAYSHAKADFDKYAGKSESDMQTISLYGKQVLPYNFYAAGRLGASYVSTEVKRELLDTNGNTVEGRINHHDKMFSSYVELGKKIGWINPFIGYSFDFLKRGEFDESNAAWGIKAASKDYRTSSFLVGLRAEYVADKYRLNASVTQVVNVNGRELGYEGSYSGYSLNQKYYGIRQAKNTTWVGVGGFREINPLFGIYGNLDFRFEDGKRADSVISTGIQFRF